MSDQFQQKIIEYIDSIAHGIGVASQFVFETLVRQKIVEGSVYTCSIILFSIIYIILLKMAIKYVNNRIEIKNANKSSYNIPDDWSDYPQFIIPFGVAGVILLIAVFVGLPNSIMEIFNPQYYALKDILDAVK